MKTRRHYMHVYRNWISLRTGQAYCHAVYCIYTVAHPHLAPSSPLFSSPPSEGGCGLILDLSMHIPPTLTLTHSCTDMRVWVYVRSLSFRAWGLGEGFSPDLMPPLESQPPLAPVAPAWEILSLLRGWLLCQQGGESDRYLVMQRRRKCSRALQKSTRTLLLLPRPRPAPCIFSLLAIAQMNVVHVASLACVVGRNIIISMQIIQGINVSVVLKRAVYV